MMSDQKTMAASPDLYLKTPKTMLLSLIKLAEAVMAIYFAYTVFAKEVIKSEFLNLLSVQGYFGGVTESGLIVTFFGRLITSNDMTFDAYLKAQDTIETVSRIAVGGMFTLVAVEGLAFCAGVWTQQGAGVVKAIRTIRLLAAVIGLLWVIYDVGDTLISLSKHAGDYNTSMTKLIEYNYGTVFKFIVQIIAHLAVPIVLIIYHANAVKLLSAAGPELHTGRMYGTPMHRMEKISGFAAVIFAAAALVTFVRAVGNGTEFKELPTYFSMSSLTLIISGTKFMSFCIIGVMMVKYVLVCLCSLDFDRIHRQNRS